MIRTILVPTDGSPHADKAVALAGDLARLHGAKVALLYAVPDIVREGVPEDYEALASAEHLRLGDVLVAVGREILGRAKAKLQDQDVEVSATALPNGPPAQAIVDYAKSNNIDLIVIGSRGLSDVKSLMLGSVSHKVCNLAPCSCLTVR